VKKNTQEPQYALFGGSFDPPHKGHFEIITKALEIANKIIVVPTFLNPFKNSFSASPNKRLEWVKKSFNLANVIISNYEIEQNRPVYTIETLEALSKKYPIKYIIIGADNLKSLEKWYNFEDLNSKITWIIATRNKEKLDTSKLKSFKIIDVDKDVSSSEIRAGKKLEFLDKKIRKEVIDEYKLTKKSR